MNSHRRCSVLFVPVLLALLAARAPALADNMKARANFVRFDPAAPEALPPDADAKGTLRIETKVSTGRDRLKVVVKRVSSAETYTLWMEDPDDLGGDLVQVGTLEKSGNSQKYSIDTDKGQALPFDETSFDDLIGLAVEVRVGSTVYLSTVVPAFGASKDRLKAKQDLGLALNSPDTNGTGRVDLSSRASNDDQRFRVKVKAIDFDSHTFFLFVETAVGSGMFENAGIFTRKSKNTGEYDHRTRDGDPLPFGELSASDFSGRQMEVRDQNDVAYLSALIPQLN